MDEKSAGNGAELAIIGMACRFPGAGNIKEFWENLIEGRESVTFFSDEQLTAAGVDPAFLPRDDYVKARCVLDDVECFDAEFFGVNPREAEIMDPQHRLFLECAWTALEDAGYVSEEQGSRIGIYAGCGINTYLINNILRSGIADLDTFQLMLGNDKDTLATRASYKFGFTGPSIAVQTSCSTSLVCIYLACQALWSGQCEMAIAGASSIKLPQIDGYWFRSGGVFSPDGHCRAFDAQAKGTVVGSGVGAVVLKPLAGAIADGDDIYAVIKGAAINNDGNEKVSYTAPSVAGQAAVITEALTFSQVDPATISYVECHGTGTELGDPVEVAALTKAFQSDLKREQPCAIGSVKTNVGHLDQAAGMAGLIKAALALKNHIIPASLNFNLANSNIDLANGTFTVNNLRKTWDSPGYPRRAGVSSFGIGGTNAHVVLEEAPFRIADARPPEAELILLSSHSADTLAAERSNLAQALEGNVASDLCDASFTLAVGRRALPYRNALVARRADDAAAQLRAGGPIRVFEGRTDGSAPHVVLMFPGQGAQRVGMARDLYERIPLFRMLVEQCLALLDSRTATDLRAALLVREGSTAGDTALQQTSLAQPALFIVEFALASVLRSWGIVPAAMIGHSVGEYVAACLAGVIELADALRLISYRASLIQQLPAGAMLGLACDPARIQEHLGSELSIAAINARERCVVAGPVDAIESLEETLRSTDIVARRLQTSHAFHSRMVDPILSRFADQVGRIRFSEPRVPYVSNVTGTWITKSDVSRPGYWVDHLRNTVQFGRGLSAALERFDGFVLEAGPGSALTTSGLRSPAVSKKHKVLPLLGDKVDSGSQLQTFLSAIGQLWVAGTPIVWNSYFEGRPCRRTRLPTYPLARRRYWIDRDPAAGRQARSSDNEARAADHIRPDLTTQFIAARSDTERQIAAIWQARIGIGEIGMQDNFLQLGGDSLLATQIVAEIRKTLSVDLSLASFLENPTIESIAAAVEALRKGTQSDADVEALLREIEQLPDEEVDALLAREASE